MGRWWVSELRNICYAKIVRIWRINFRPFIIPAIVFGGLFLAGFIIFRAFALPAFIPQPFVQRAIVPRTVEKRQLEPARNLVGNWQGTAKYIFNQTAISYCDMWFNVTLTIANQTGNNIGGNVVVTWQKSEQHGNFACAAVPPTNDPINGTISGSRLNFNAGGQGNFTGSFTTDTITLNQPRDANGDGLVGPVNLLRQ